MKLNKSVGLLGQEDFSGFDGTVDEKKKSLQTLETQYQQASQDLIAEQAKLNEIASKRGDCKRKLFWDNGCLSDNTRAQDQARANIDNLTGTVARLQKQVESERISLAELTKTQAEAEAAKKKAEAELKAAEGNANPDVIKSQLEAQKTLSQLQISGANSKTIIYFAGAFCIAVVIGVTVYFLKR